jgi:hypothetical protein
MSAVRDVALEKERQQSDKLPNESSNHLGLRLESLTKTSRPSISAHVHVAVNLSAATTTAMISAIEDLVAAAKRPSSTTFPVHVAGLSCKHLCHVGLDHHHAISPVTEPKIVVILRCHITVTRKMSNAQSVPSLLRRNVFVAKRP